MKYPDYLDKLKEYEELHKLAKGQEVEIDKLNHDMDLVNKKW